MNATKTETPATTIRTVKVGRETFAVLLVDSETFAAVSAPVRAVEYRIPAPPVAKT